MQFVLSPILDQMEDLYLLPHNKTRFEKYLLLLQGYQGEDLQLPIGAYNPMGNENTLLKLRELLKLDAEALAAEVLDKINNQIAGNESREISVVLNLVDDVGGAWSHRHTTGFSNSFRLEALIKRNFCTPCFWTSENYTMEKIKNRTESQVYRCLYQIKNAVPQTLHDHVEQEIYVLRNLARPDLDLKKQDLSKVEQHYLENGDSEDYNLIFNFFYGDAASQSLGFKTYGVNSEMGRSFLLSKSGLL